MLNNYDVTANMIEEMDDVTSVDELMGQLDGISSMDELMIWGEKYLIMLEDYIDPYEKCMP